MAANGYTHTSIRKRAISGGAPVNGVFDVIAITVPHRWIPRA
jgi:hypothetical protein